MSVTKLNQCGIAVILSKKNIKLATKRNQVRRIIKEFFRLHQYDFYNRHAVILSKKGTVSATKEQLWLSLERFYQEFVESR